MDKEARLVSRAIALTLKLIAEQDAELARLLSKSIETGHYLSYSPLIPGESSRQITVRKENATSPRKEPGPTSPRTKLSG